jgi:uncharacterized membrane protein
LARAHAVTLACYCALLLLFTSTNIIRPDGGFKLWLVQCLPLLLFVPGLVWTPRSGYRNWRTCQWRTYSWLCFVTLLYFIWAVTDVMSPEASIVGLLTLILSVVLFGAAMMASRWQQRWSVALRDQAHNADAKHQE